MNDAIMIIIMKKLVYFIIVNSYTYILLLFAVKYKFMTLWLNTTINSSALSGPLHLIKYLLKLLIIFSAFSQWGVGSRFASHFVYKFDKQIARCNNSQIKILNLFQFPHVLAA